MLLDFFNGRKLKKNKKRESSNLSEKVGDLLSVLQTGCARCNSSRFTLVGIGNERRRRRSIGVEVRSRVAQWSGIERSASRNEVEIGSEDGREVNEGGKRLAKGVLYRATRLRNTREANCGRGRGKKTRRKGGGWLRTGSGGGVEGICGTRRGSGISRLIRGLGVGRGDCT